MIVDFSQDTVASGGLGVGRMLYDKDKITKSFLKGYRFTSPGQST